jgi:hypothetical protein
MDHKVGFPDFIFNDTFMNEIYIEVIVNIIHLTWSIANYCVKNEVGNRSNRSRPAHFHFGPVRTSQLFFVRPVHFGPVQDL